MADAANSAAKPITLRRTAGSGNLVRPLHLNDSFGPLSDSPNFVSETTAAEALLGVGTEAGADEDDFHTFRRKNAEVDRDVMAEERTRKMAKVKAGVHTGIVKAFGSIPTAKPKKIVNF